MVFGGAQAGLYVGNQAWAEAAKAEGVVIEEIGIRDEEARIRFNTGVAVLGTDEQFARVEARSFKVLSDATVSLEVTAIHPPDKTTKESYIAQSKILQNKLGPLEPLGKLICKAWLADDCDEWDLPQDESQFPGGKPQPFNDHKVFEFWLEESVLEDCFVDMKMDASILTLEGGLTILDDVRECMCSFFTWLPNELWMERKPREVRWLKKGLGLDDDEEVEAQNGEHNTKDHVKANFDDEFDDD